MPTAGAGSFFLLHRHRIFNARQGVWMGWERKRGKLLDLNKLLKGQFDAFPVKAGNLERAYATRNTSSPWTPIRSFRGARRTP